MKGVTTLIINALLEFVKTPTVVSRLRKMWSKLWWLLQTKHGTIFRSCVGPGKGIGTVTAKPLLVIQDSVERPRECSEMTQIQEYVLNSVLKIGAVTEQIFYMRPKGSFCNILTYWIRTW